MFRAGNSAFAPVSAFQTNTNVFNNSVMTTASAQNAKNVMLFSDLTNITDTLTPLFYQYSLGNFQYVADTLTQDYYNTMSTTLSDMAQNSNIYPQYEAIRIEITRAFEGLRQCVYQYATLLDTQAKYAIDESILNDMEKLKKYLEGKRGMSIFPDCDVTVGYATLKPLYAMYVELFGFPEGCVFEVDKLAIAQSYL